MTVEQLATLDYMESIAVSEGSRFWFSDEASPTGPIVWASIRRGVEWDYETTSWIIRADGAAEIL